MPDTDWDKVSYVLRSDYRTDTLLALNSPQTPSEISEDIELNINHVSRALKHLRENDCVELLVPEETKKGRIYGQTETGEEIAEAIEDRD